MKTVSIVMCTYNGEQFLREQLDSILAQTYPIHELIIQDDCSTDHTADIVREYARQYPFIRFYANISNLGFNRNFQDALSKAEGDYIAIADQDDIWYEEKIAAQMEAIGDNDLCVSAYHTGTVYRSDRNIKVTHPSCQLEYLLFYDSTPGHSMLTRKDPVSLFRLCLTCMLHKQTIYYNPRQKGLISWVRAFFYPMIRAYGNTYFRL